MLTVNPGGLLSVNILGTLTDSGTVTVNTGGMLTVGNGGMLTVNTLGTLTDSGTLTNTGGTITVGSGSTLTVNAGSTLTVNGGTITIDSSGSLGVGANGSLGIGSSGTLIVDPASSATINSGGSITYGAGDSTIVGSFTVSPSGVSVDPSETVVVGMTPVPPTPALPPGSFSSLLSGGLTGNSGIEPQLNADGLAELARTVSGADLAADVAGAPG